MNESRTEPLTGIAVVGSANLDLVAYAPRQAAPGETVPGTGFERHPDGKSLNQAVAVADATVTAFVGYCGDDDAASVLRESPAGPGVDTGYFAARPGAGGRALVTAVVLRELSAGHGVDTGYFTAKPGVDTAYFIARPGAGGRALITVMLDGENSSTVLPEANHRPTAAHVTVALDALVPTIVLTQQVVPGGVIAAAADRAGRHGARPALDASPSGPLDERVLAAADPLIVNRGEAAYLAGTDEPRTAARILAARSAAAVVTLGADGYLIAEGDRLAPLPAPSLTAVDTTGAGDAFAGVLVAHLSHGADLTKAAQEATQAAARAVQTPRSAR